MDLLGHVHPAPPAKLTTPMATAVRTHEQLRSALANRTSERCACQILLIGHPDPRPPWCVTTEARPGCAGNAATAPADKRNLHRRNLVDLGENLVLSSTSKSEALKAFNPLYQLWTKPYLDTNIGERAIIRFDVVGTARQLINNAFWSGGRLL